MRYTPGNEHFSHDFVRCNLAHVGLRCSGPPCAGAKRRRTMKTSKQIPRRLKIDVMISIVGLGLIALAVVTTTARILDVPVLVLVAGWH